MAHSQTSLNAYVMIESLGITGRQEKVVYGCLTAHPFGLTRNELSVATGLRINAVCGRVRGLVKRGLLKEQESRQDSITGMKNKVVRVR